ncbi:MAG: iron ABC transporter permease [Crocinitomicaceae bacterium]|nr:iron ABC transporter permease [Crocinitomicaceae bacterium]
MSISKRHITILLVLVALLPVSIYLHLMSGQISLSIGDYTDALFSYDDQNFNQLIAREIRIPRMAMALLAGAALSVSGLLMQTLFNNPLAGPYVLGINSGASLFVAFSFMTGIPILTTTLGTVSSALIGAFLFGLIIMSFSYVVRSHISLLLIGLMLGSFTSALVYVLQSMSASEELKAFTMWAMGSLQHVDLSQLLGIFGLFMLGIVGSLVLIKPLNAMVLGEKDATLLGINFKSVRLIIILITALLTGLITAYCGPIAFVGLAIPNLVRILFKSQNHLLLLIASCLIGGIFLLGCDSLIQLVEAKIHVPINALTSIIGAPFVVFIILKRLA